MKATINGIVVEGTPQEIHELMVQMGPVKLSIDAPKEPDLQEGVHYEIIKMPKKMKVHSEPQTFVPSSVQDLVKLTLQKQSKCPAIGPCYCTGACLN